MTDIKTVVFSVAWSGGEIQLADAINNTYSGDLSKLSFVSA